jgi:cysteine synthase
LVEVPGELNPYQADGVRVYAKLMFLLPLLSIKSLPVLHMMTEAAATGQLDGVHTVVESSSGNAAFSLAIIARLFGVRDVIALVPGDIPAGKLDLLRLAGAEPRLGKAGEPSGIVQARELGKQRGVFNPAQYSNTSNPAAYARWVGPELWAQTDGKATVFAAGLGTSGTLVGTAQYFRSEGASVRTVGVICRSEQSVPGVRSAARLQEVGHDWQGAADHIVEVSTDEAFVKSVSLCQAGLMAGPSSGFALAGLLRFLCVERQAERLDQLRNADGDVVAVFTCGDTPLPYLDCYSAYLHESEP